jgi:uncharacterized protein YbjT (DUF2867 family)
MNQPILVAGGTGRTGRIIVQKLLALGQQPRVLVRDPAAARNLLGDKPLLFQGDVRDPATLAPAVEGCPTLISAIGSRSPVGPNCPKRVDYAGVAHLVDAALAADIKRFILISSIAVTQPDHPMNRFGKVLHWKREGERHLETSGLAYTILRPGGLTQVPGDQRQLIFEQGDQISGTISRADVAEACLQALTRPASAGLTFELISDGAKGPPDWENLFAGLM